MMVGGHAEESQNCIASLGIVRDLCAPLRSQRLKAFDCKDCEEIAEGFSPWLERHKTWAFEIEEPENQLGASKIHMSAAQSGASLTPQDFARAWWRILNGHVPMLSIEITRECPLSCPGCYAYGDSHLGGDTTLRELSDFRGDALVEGVVELVRRHRPLPVSLVGSEPMLRHRELGRIIPALSEMGVFTMVVTSGVIAIPSEWMKIPRLRVAVSVDGLPEHHDERRKPATYERILKNIAGRSINVHWVITGPPLW